MGLFKNYVSQTRKPEGFLGKMMLGGMNSGHAKLADWGFTHLPAMTPESAADLGCGGGPNAGELLKMYPKAHVTAVDYSELSAEKAKEYNKTMIAAGRYNMQKLIKTTCKIAAENIGKERAGHIAEIAQIRYQELCLENISDPKALRAHTFKRIYPAIAVYEALKEYGVDREKAVWYIREYFQRFAAAYVPHLQRTIRIFRLAKRIPALFMKISVKSFGTDAGFEYEFPESSGNEARFNIVHCPYYETCKRYGCPEITRAFCDGDDAGYGNLHPKLVWGRTKTIGRGGDCCDFLLKYTE